MSTHTFSSMGLSVDTLNALKANGFVTPTSVQQRAIGPMLAWRDLIARAPTGTGKTLAFGIPLLEHLEPDMTAIDGLVLAPTRELAIQIKDDIRALATTRPAVKTVTVYGGQSIQSQITALKTNPVIVVATPGRLIDLMKRRAIDLSHVRTAVLDEADRMVDMGFVRDVRHILDRLPAVQQIGMFSATLSRAVMDISYLYQRHPVDVSVSQVGLDKPDIDEYVTRANGVERIDQLTALLSTVSFDRTMIFVNMKQSATMVSRKLGRRGFHVDEIHGDVTQGKRERVLTRFRDGQLPILVATDVAARGLDIDDVDLVVNYDLPIENENYLHRIGRTGRAQKKGLALTFLPPTGDRRLAEIKHAMKTDPKTLETIDELIAILTSNASPR